jgi:hypothetical protein
VTIVGVLSVLVLLASLVVSLCARLPDDYREPAPDLDVAIAQSAQRIVKLHRELGIDPMYDPIPGAREPTPVHPLLVRTCPFDCDWMMGGSHLITLTAFVNHVSVDHPETRPSVLEALRQGLARQQQIAEREAPANGAPADYDG